MARVIIGPYIEERRNLQQANGNTLRLNYAIEWLEEEAARRPYDAAAAHLNLSLAAIHTTTDLVSEVMINLLRHPELFTELRHEITNVLRNQGVTAPEACWKLQVLPLSLSKGNLTNLQVFMTRMAAKDVTQSDDSALRSGQRCEGDDGSHRSYCAHTGDHG
ncbi:hypothetical protein FDECE_11184 [Fusarium decemcellulare]|nr:hypothetical protein FDECE_11184 [Fusarium decemcellulare]